MWYAAFLGYRQSFNMHDSHAVCASLLIFAAHKDSVCEELRFPLKRAEE
ncbi:hypothetical protein GOA59_28955 [Sinorhizobium meliloti]|nr:hypothetical protein [Sinorhizobium meliloti]MDW9386353.1 hypothetical protein [Sinorhizobium meliloti]MDW9394304.1 hypothetical protein [Sinorhizobium meliloti]MDW9400631.1 hypothetical protein [Sinorhizobium meliloti]MDW9430918.1 hypothetical protein [Sinorhizobium meliloti]